MDKCTIRGAGDLACAGVERSAVVGIEGQLRRLRVCGVHFEWLGQVTTPLGVGNPYEKPASEERPQAKKATRGRGRPRLSRQIATACLLDDGTEISWPAVRAKLAEWGMDVPPSGPLPQEHVDYFKERYASEGTNGVK